MHSCKRPTVICACEIPILYILIAVESHKCQLVTLAPLGSGEPWTGDSGEAAGAQGQDHIFKVWCF